MLGGGDQSFSLLQGIKIASGEHSVQLFQITGFGVCVDPVWNSAVDSTPGHVFEMLGLDLQLHAHDILFVALGQIHAATSRAVFGFALRGFVINIDDFAFAAAVYRGLVLDAAHGVDGLRWAFLEQVKENLPDLRVFDAAVVTVVDAADGHVGQGEAAIAEELVQMAQKGLDMRGCGVLNLEVFQGIYFDGAEER